jgi:lactose/L-arabinose transport system ATP-binding protein
MAQLELRGVQKSFGAVNVIPNVDLDIEDGEFCVFVGPSGCGKSTLLRMISGLEEVSGGTIKIGTEDVTYKAPAKRGVAMVFQSYALYPHMSVEQNLTFGLSLTDMPKTEIKAKVDEAARVLELTPLMDRKPKALSGGQRQRVAIGRSIVREPKVFLFDEPLSNLDAELRVQMRIEIARLHQDLGATMVYVPHDQVEAMTLADKIVVLRAGKIEQAGSPITLYDDPDNLFVAGFIGSPRMNLIDAKVVSVDGKEVTVDLAGFSGTHVTVPTRNGIASIGDAVTFGVRPEHFVPAEETQVVISPKALVVEQLGGVSYIYAEGREGAQITVEQKGHAVAPAGSNVDIGINPATCFLFAKDGARI